MYCGPFQYVNLSLFSLKKFSWNTDLNIFFYSIILYFIFRNLGYLYIISSLSSIFVTFLWSFLFPSLFKFHFLGSFYLCSLFLLTILLVISVLPLVAGNSVFIFKMTFFFFQVFFFFRVQLALISHFPTLHFFSEFLNFWFVMFFQICNCMFKYISCMLRYCL